MPNLEDIFKDPDFRSLPIEEKRRAFLEYDPDFSSLPKGEQDKGINELMTKTATIPQLLGRTVLNIPESGWRVGKGLAQMATHPFQTAESMGGYAGKVGRAGLEQLFGEPVDIEARKAVESYAEPVKKTIEEPLKAPRRGLEWVSEHPVETALTSYPIMRSLGFSPKLGITEAITKPLKGKSVTNIVEEGIGKGVKPSVSGKGSYPLYKQYFNKAEDAVRDIVSNKESLSLTTPTGETLTGTLPRNLRQFSEAINQRLKSTFNEYDTLVQEAGQTGATVNVIPIAKELRSLAQKAPVSDLNKPLKNYAIKMADTLEQRGMYSLSDAQDAIATLNSRLDAFYKNPTYQTASIAYADSLIANNLRKFLDKTIDSLTGERYQPLKNQYGALKTLEKDVTHRAIVDARRNIKGLLDFSDVFTGYHVIRGLINFEPSYIAAGGAAKTIAWLYKLKNDPNRIIRKMFDKAEKKIGKEPPFTPYAGPPGTQIPRFPESKYMVSEPVVQEGTPNLPIPFVPRKTGMPVPAGEGFGVEAVRQPRLEWWRGQGAKGVQQMPTPPSENILPPGMGFTTREGLGPTSPTGKGRAQFESRQKEKWWSKPSVTPEEYRNQITIARDSYFKGVPISKVREMFKTRTGEELPSFVLEK